MIHKQLLPLCLREQFGCNVILPFPLSYFHQDGPYKILVSAGPYSKFIIFSTSICFQKVQENPEDAIWPFKIMTSPYIVHSFLGQEVGELGINYSRVDDKLTIHCKTLSYLVKHCSIADCIFMGKCLNDYDDYGGET